jgi:hypothetical protein
MECSQSRLHKETKKNASELKTFFYSDIFLFDELLTKIYKSKKSPTTVEDLLQLF